MWSDGRGALRPRVPASLACCLAVLIIVLAGALPAAGETQDRFPSEKIARLTQEAMEAFHVPGMAVGILHQGRTVYAAGHGVRNTATGAPVTADTVFEIASLTKAFTGLALAMLAEDGKLSLDDPVVRHLPEFEMIRPRLTGRVTVMDLLTHRSGLGLGQGDLLFWPDVVSTRDQVLEAFRHLKPPHDLRARFAYNNLGYIAAGSVIKAASGIAWEGFISQRIMNPLGLDGCAPGGGDVAETVPVAVPYMRFGGDWVETRPWSPEPVSAAAAMVCDLDSMLDWARFHLEEGVSVGGDRLIAPATHGRLWEPAATAPLSAGLRALGGRDGGYGLGWFTAQIRGEPVVFHSGGALGFTTYMLIAPDRDFAAIALSNAAYGGDDATNHGPQAVVLAAFEAAFEATSGTAFGAAADRRARDWIGFFKDKERASLDRHRESLAAAARMDTRPPRLPLPAYSGRYRDPWFGAVTVDHEKGANGEKELSLTFDRSDLLHGRLRPVGGDRFILRWDIPWLQADAFLTFHRDENGAPGKITMEAISPRTDFSFDFHDLALVRVEAQSAPHP